MYVERNVFYLKFGAGRAAINLWKDYLNESCTADERIKARLLTDLSGPAYVIILELTYNSYAELEPGLCRLVRQPGWKPFYEKFIPLCERSERILYHEVFNSGS